MLDLSALPGAVRDRVAGRLSEAEGAGHSTCRAHRCSATS